MSERTSLRQAYTGFGRGFEQMKVDLLAAHAELNAISAAIGTNDYLDPPDGGSVPLAEQVARMAKDAARYRWLRENRNVLLLTGFFGNGCINRTVDEVDAQIDVHLS